MNRWVSIVAHALGCALVAGPAHAQPLPLRLPPLPPPSFDTAPNTAHWETKPQAFTPRVESRDFEAVMHESSETAREALRRSQVHETWYGWQTLTVDAAAIGVLLLGAAIVKERPPSFDAGASPRPLAFGALSLAVYAAGPAFVHVARGDVWKAFASAGLRVAMPLAGFALASAVGAARQSQGDSPSADGAFGGVLGSVAAMATDAIALGWQRWYGAGAPGRTALFRVSASF